MSRSISLRKFRTAILALCVALSSAASSLAFFAPRFNIETVAVGDPGNAPDTAVMDDGTTAYGSVPYAYRIGTFEVTIDQYTTFLNSVATNNSQPHITALWNSNMATDRNIAGISRSGSGVAGDPFVYTPIGPFGTKPAGASSAGNRPITYVSWFDAARFANWMHNGATNGASTETGAYTLNGATNGIVEKNANAVWWIPTENEWYKAAYYKGGGTNSGYNLMATGFSGTPNRRISERHLPNTVNRCINGGVGSSIFFTVTGDANAYSTNQNYLSDVGAFFASPSPYGTFDQSGNVDEWNGAVISGALRGFRGGNWSPQRNDNAERFDQVSSLRRNGVVNDQGLPTSELPRIGFRLATLANTNSSGNADLSDLFVSDRPAAFTPSAMNLTPAFAPSRLFYQGSGFAKKVIIKATAADASATITINGTPVASGSFSPPLGTPGLNRFEIRVTAADGVSSKVYYLNIDLLAEASATPASACTLGSLAIQSAGNDPNTFSPVPGTLTPNFASQTTSYTSTSFGFNIGSIAVSAVGPNNATITARLNGTELRIANSSTFFTRELPLSVGANNLEVRCIAANGSDFTSYFVSIARDASDNNADLNSLALLLETSPIRTRDSVEPVLEPLFQSGITNYTTRFGFQFATILGKSASPSRRGAKMEIRMGDTEFTDFQNQPRLQLNFGSNKLEVRVTATDGVTKKTYFVDAVKLNNNANLASLTADVIPGLSLVPGVTSYTLRVSGRDRITFTPRAAAQGASIALKVDTGVPTEVPSGQSTTVPIGVGTTTNLFTVTAPDRTTTTDYRVEVIRTSSADASLLNLRLFNAANNAAVGTITPAFDRSRTNYTAGPALDSSISAVSVNAAAPFGATLEVRCNGGSFSTLNSGANSGPLPLTFALGGNTIEIKSTAEDGTTVRTNYLTVFRQPRSNATLQSLSPSAGTLNPVFSGSVTNYTVNVPFATSTISLTPRGDSRATIEVRSNNTSFPLENGTARNIPLPNSGPTSPNNISVKVTAENALTISNYFIAVMRAAPSTNANLSAVDVTREPRLEIPPFLAVTPPLRINITDQTIVNYSQEIPNKLDQIYVRPILADATAKCDWDLNGFGFVPLNRDGFTPALPLRVGRNTLTLRVTAQDGSRKLYTFTLTRLAGLANLALSSGTLSPAFDWRTTSYTASVPNVVRSMRLTPSATDSTITVSVNGGAPASVPNATAFPIALNVGTNNIVITVTSLNGTSTKTYTVAITRAPSSNADLKALRLSAGDLSPAFAPNTTGYTATVPATTSSISVRPFAAEANAFIRVRVNAGNFIALSSGQLSNPLPLNPGGNTVRVELVAQDNTTTKAYTITVTRGS